MRGIGGMSAEKYIEHMRIKAVLLWEFRKDNKVLSKDFKRICNLHKLTSVRPTMASFARFDIPIPDIWDLPEVKYKRFSDRLMAAASKKDNGKLTYKEMMPILGMETKGGTRYKYEETRKRGFPVPEAQMEKKYTPPEKPISPKQKPIKKYDTEFWYPKASRC